jgi:hypothetical protein
VGTFLRDAETPRCGVPLALVSTDAMAYVRESAESSERPYRRTRASIAGQACETCRHRYVLPGLSTAASENVVSADAALRKSRCDEQRPKCESSVCTTVISSSHIERSCLSKTQCGLRVSGACTNEVNSSEQVDQSESRPSILLRTDSDHQEG